MELCEAGVKCKAPVEPDGASGRAHGGAGDGTGDGAGDGGGEERENGQVNRGRWMDVTIAIVRENKQPSVVCPQSPAASFIFNKVLSWD